MERDRAPEGEEPECEEGYNRDETAEVGLSVEREVSGGIEVMSFAESKNWIGGRDGSDPIPVSPSG